MTRGRKFLMSAIAVAGALGILELTSRLWAPPAPPDRSLEGLPGSIFMGSPARGWTLRPGFRGQFEDGIRREIDAQGFMADDSAQLTDQNASVVAFIGDSNTFGFGVSATDAFVEVADSQLNGVHAINLGVPGYSSTQGLDVAKVFLQRHRPRVAVISFNYNDRRYSVFGPDSAERYREIYKQTDEYFPTWLARRFEWSATFRGLRTLIRKDAAPAGADAEPVPRVSIDSLAPRVSDDLYRKNLREFVDLLTARSVRPVFLVLRDNPTFARDLRAGIALLDRGDGAGAVKLLYGVMEGEWNLMVRPYLSRAYRISGDEASANAVLQVKRPTGPLDVDGDVPVRLDLLYNDIMREVAKERGIEVIEGAAVLETTPHVFIDECHFNAEGHRALGTLLAQRLSRYFK